MSTNWDEQYPVSKHVIVIEHEPVMRMLLRETLEDLGYTSASFEDAVQALTYLRYVEGDCAFIIADQGMPRGMQGSEFIRMAKERWPSIPSILTSGFFVDEQVVPPSTVYLHKPYTLNQLEATIDAVLLQESVPTE
ncbi:response regulator [Pseudomonas prosekii]|uniref:response regulator n=1 Tax=Pseudomonas prosekii TaxID=1148509 RepID=UPI0011EAEA81|nr:response regulator [Pseudomonas prosekii]